MTPSPSLPGTSSIASPALSTLLGISVAWLTVSRITSGTFDSKMIPPVSCLIHQTSHSLQWMSVFGLSLYRGHPDPRIRREQQLIFSLRSFVSYELNAPSLFIWLSSALPSIWHLPLFHPTTLFPLSAVYHLPSLLRRSLYIDTTILLIPQPWLTHIHILTPHPIPTYSHLYHNPSLHYPHYTKPSQPKLHNITLPYHIITYRH